MGKKNLRNLLIFWRSVYYGDCIYAHNLKYGDFVNQMRKERAHKANLGFRLVMTKPLFSAVGKVAINKAEIKLKI